MDRPIFSNRLPSLPVFFSCSRSGGGCERCSCCSRVYCSCSAFCFFSSSWCRCSSCSCLEHGCAGGSGIGGLPKPPPPPPPLPVNEPFRPVGGGGGAGGLSADDDDTEPLGDVVGTEPPPAAHAVGDATGDLELVRGGGGGGIRLFCRSGVRSGTGGFLPVSDDVLLNRLNTGLGATAAAAAAVVVAVAVAGTAASASAVPIAAAAAAVAGGIVWSSSSRVSSAFSAPVGFPARPSVPVPVWSTTLPCPTTPPCETDKRNVRFLVFYTTVSGARCFQRRI